MRTAEYVLTEDHRYGDIVLRKNSHISPVWNERYLPNHLDRRNLDMDVWCYTRFGFLKIPQNIIRKIY